MEVQPHVVTVLADTAIRAEDLDEKAAEEAKAKAEAALEGKDPEDLDYGQLQTELDALKAQIHMIHNIGKSIHG
jgi:F-type H+-transporting ATPase subunit epsilon